MMKNIKLIKKTAFCLLALATILFTSATFDSNLFDDELVILTNANPLVNDYAIGNKLPPQSFQQRFGYMPEKRNTKAGVRMVEAAGECSWMPDTGAHYDYQNACKTHDYMYDLVRAGILPKDNATKKTIDNLLYNDCKKDCSGRFVTHKKACEATALTVLKAVNAKGYGF